MRRILIVVVVSHLFIAHVAVANPISELLKAGGRAVIGKGGRTAAKEGAKQLTKQAVAKTARNAVKTAAQTRAAQTLRYFGDDALRVGGRVGSKVSTFADDAAKVSGSLTAQNHRRLMMLAPELQKSGRATNVMKQLASSSKADDAVEFLWRHRGKLAAATAVTATAFHADDLAKAGGEFIAKPLIDNAMEHVAKPVVTAATRAALICLLVVGLAFAFKYTAFRSLIWKLPDVLRSFSAFIFRRS